MRLPILGVAALAAGFASAGVIVKDGDTIAFMGDSITERAARPNCYPDMVALGLAKAGVRVSTLNAGVGGNVARQMDQRFARDVVAKKPQWVTIMAGVNDAGGGYTVGQYMSFVTSMIAKAEAAGIRPVLVSPTVVSELHHAASKNDRMLDRYTEALADCAAKRGLPFADAHAEFLKALKARGDCPDLHYTCDNCHLNGPGYELVACAILQALGVGADEIAAAQAEWRKLPRTEQLAVEDRGDTVLDSVVLLRARMDRVRSVYPNARILLVSMPGHWPRADAMNLAASQLADGVNVFWVESVVLAHNRANRLALASRPATPMPRFSYGPWDLWLRRFAAKRREIKDSGGKIDLVFAGDSITQGWEGAGKEVLAELAKTYSILDIGYGGDATQHLAWRLENGELDGYKAKCVMLLIGTNNGGDTPERIAAGVRTCLDTIRRKQPQAKVILLPIFPRGADKTAWERAHNGKVNAIIRGYADGKDVFWVDFNRRFLKDDGSETLPREMMSDLLHPTRAGYEIWREEVEPYFRRFCGRE